MNENNFKQKEESANNINTDSEEISNILNLKNKVKDLNEKKYKFNLVNYNINKANNIANFNTNNQKKETIDINDIPKLLGKENNNYNDNNVNSIIKDDNIEINHLEYKNNDNILDVIKFQNENKN